MFIRWLLFPSSHRGVLVPGGFGVRGTEGKMLAINWARKQNKPYLGKTNVNLQSHVFIVLKSNDDDTQKSSVRRMFTDLMYIGTYM